MKKNFWIKRNIILLIVAAAIVSAGGNYLYARKFSMLPDGTVGLLANTHEPTLTDRVLIITPHFDDETIAAGGYIQRAISNKSEIMVVVVTDGNRRGDGAERHKEFAEVMKILGVGSEKIRFLDLPEYYLKEKITSDKLISILSDEVDNFKPTIILYPDTSDKNSDHKYIGGTLDNILARRIDLYTYTYLVHWKYFPQPVGLHIDKHMTPPIKLLDFTHNWQKFDLSGSEEDTKLSALLVYKSQLRTPLLHDLLVSMVRTNELFSEKLVPVTIEKP